MFLIYEEGHVPRFHSITKTWAILISFWSQRFQEISPVDNSDVYQIPWALLLSH